MKTKPFNLQAAIDGAKLVTRDGREVKFIVYVPEARPAYKVVVLLGREIRAYREDGKFHWISEGNLDLFLAVPTKSINGYEYPDPERVEPEKGTRYWVPSHLADENVYASSWYGTPFDMLMLRRGLIHLTREAAEAHARAIILAGGGEV
ncbi:hypothetical protein [uncultured Halomonas sp.]|uniref:hypothetical protein n=1 Tax=uncultured Halomonas sp. TaxID=173971 RepID=UPI0026057777|nr:hypothetical protein [uncultured Halomonas sp.]